MTKIDQLSGEAQEPIDKLRLSPGAGELLRTTCLFAPQKTAENHIISSTGLLFAAVGIGKALQRGIKGPFSSDEHSALNALATKITSERDFYTSQRRGFFYSELPTYPATANHSSKLRFSENVYELFKKLEDDDVDACMILIDLLQSPRGWLEGRFKEFGPATGKVLHDAIVDAITRIPPTPPSPVPGFTWPPISGDAKSSPKEEQSRKIFISYSHRDANWLTLLQTHLQPLKLHHGIDFWDDTRLRPGSQWRIEIKEAIEAAEVVILLMSANFIASEFIAKNELPPSLKAAKQRGKLVIPVILNHAFFAGIPELGEFQSINPPSKPLAGMTSVKRAKILADLTEAVHAHISQQT